FLKCCDLVKVSHKQVADIDPLPLDLQKRPGRSRPLPCLEQDIASEPEFCQETHHANFPMLSPGHRRNAVMVHIITKILDEVILLAKHLRELFCVGWNRIAPVNVSGMVYKGLGSTGSGEHFL